MFQKPLKHTKTDMFDSERIQQHIAAIKFLSDTLLLSTQKHRVSSHLSVLLNAIESFEKHRFSDYGRNKTKRAEQVLHTRKIFNGLYKDHLKASSSSIIAHALKHELKDYATSVKSQVKAIKNDLSSSLINQQEAQFDQMQSDLMDNELDLLAQEAAAYRLAGLAAKAQAPENESSFAYFTLEEQSYSEDELAAKPFLRGSFRSDSDDDLYATSNDASASPEESYYSDVDSTTSMAENNDDDVEWDSDNNSESQPSLPRSPSNYQFIRHFRFYQDPLNTPDAEDESYSDDDELDTRPTEFRFSS